MYMNGIQSYFYYSPNEKTSEPRFFKLSNMPRTRLIHGEEDGYEEWLRKTFLLDGHTVDRMMECIIKLQS